MIKSHSKLTNNSKLIHPLYGTFTILSFNNSKSIDIRFDATGTLANFSAQSIRNMSIKDYNYPAIFGVGFRGYGEYKTLINGEITKAYRVWRSMIQRCYDNKCKSYKTYYDCTVSPEWCNFQNYADWFYKNYVEGCHVDKDFKIKGNRVYSESTCLFIPSAKNIKLATQKPHSFVSPSGDVIKFTNLSEFCILNNLDRVNMSRVSNGHRKSHKGWTMAT